jgi:glycosyltransferase involved in cell wall biosynthesis
MQSPLVSIIVPIYKVEPYLRRCLDSIVNQTYTNLEIILVDDGSPDGCPQICDEYAAKDERIVVIHKKNGGLSDARNAGLDICKGEYISFVDSDDWVEEQYVEILFDLLTKENADIAICSYNSFTNEIELPQFFLNGDIKYVCWDSHETLTRLCAEDTPGLMAIWGKLFKRKLFDNIRFPKGKLYEDAYVNYKLYSLADKIFYINLILCHYRVRKDSIMGKTTGSVFDIEPLIERYTFLKEHNEEAANFCVEKLCWTILFITSLNSNYFFNNSLFKNRKEAVIYFKQIAPVYISNRNYSFCKRMLLLFFYLFPKTYYLYRRLSPIHLRKE